MARSELSLLVRKTLSLLRNAASTLLECERLADLGAAAHSASTRTPAGEVVGTRFLRRNCAVKSVSYTRAGCLCGPRASFKRCSSLGQSVTRPTNAIPIDLIDEQAMAMRMWSRVGGGAQLRATALHTPSLHRSHRLIHKSLAPAADVRAFSSSSVTQENLRFDVVVVGGGHAGCEAAAAAARAGQSITVSATLFKGSVRMMLRYAFVCGWYMILCRREDSARDAEALDRRRDVVQRTSLPMPAL